MYLESMTSMFSELIMPIFAEELLVITEKSKDQSTNEYRLIGKMDHLVCFVPGLLYLGVMQAPLAKHVKELHITFADAILETCYQSYQRTPTGLAPEIFYFQIWCHRFRITIII